MGSRRKARKGLTVQNVFEVVKHVPASKWRDWDETTQSVRINVGDEEIAETDEFDFRDALGIPAQEIKPIAKKYNSLESRICAGIVWWLENHPQASWRKVLWALDAVEESELADKFRPYAEPPRDPSLTAHNVNRIMKKVQNPVSFTDSVAGSLGVPTAVEIRIIGTDKLLDESQDESNDSLDESEPHPNPGQAVGEYWRETVPGASWEMMAHALYQNNEKKALEGVKKYLTEINVIKDTTLTHRNVMEVVGQVRRGRLIDALGLPNSKRQQIEERYRYTNSEYQLLEAAVSKYLLSHPCPSWPLLTSCLRQLNRKFPKSVPAAAVEAATSYAKGRPKPANPGQSKQPETRKCEYLLKISVGVLVVGVVCGTVMMLVFGRPSTGLASLICGLLIDSNHTQIQGHDVNCTPNVPIFPPPTSDQTCPLPGCEDILEKAPERQHIDLITWKDGNETSEFRLIDLIRGKCDRISTQFKVAKAVYDGWVKKDPESACHELIQHWLESGRGPYPVTWNGFIQVLKDVELGEVAKRLKDALLKIYM